MVCVEGRKIPQISVWKYETRYGNIHERSKDVGKGKDSGEASSLMLRKAEAEASALFIVL